MSFFDKILDFVPVIGDLISGNENNDEAMDRQLQSQEFSAQQYATRYQTTVRDMAAAGLNPALAYGGISGSPPSSSAASSAGMPALGSSFNQARLASAEMAVRDATVANIKADTNNKAAQTDLIAAQTAQAYSSADQAQANVRLIGENVNKILAEIPKINAETTNVKAQYDVVYQTARMLEQQSDLMREQGMSQQTIRAQLNAQINKLVAETSLVHYDIEAISKMGNIGREAGQLKPIFELLLNIARMGRRN